MRSSVWIAALVGAVIVTAPRPAAAQTVASPRRVADVAQLPASPIPYTQLRPARSRERRVSTVVTGRGGGVRPGPLRTPLALVPNASSVSPVVGGPPSPSELEAFVDGEVRRGLDESHAPGAVVAVVQNGRVVLDKGYGLASVAPRRVVDPRSTLFRLGSVSKVFTWIEVMKAIAAGRLRWAEPINEALPTQTQVPNEGFGAPIRLEHLLDHTAGFESRDLGRLFVGSPAALAGLAEMLARWRPRRVRDPGEVYAYSNYGAALAGEAAAYGRHQAFEDLVERDLLRPAGMSSTSFREPHPDREGLSAPLPADLAARLANGFGWDARGLVAAPFAWAGGLAPAVAASATSSDMAVLIQALLGGGVAPNGVRLWDAQTEGLLTAGPPTPKLGRAPLAHGLMQEALPGGALALTQDGAVPGFRAKLTIAPSLALGVFVASNGEEAGRLTSSLAGDIVGRFYSARPLSPPPVAQDFEGLQGLYLTTRRAYHGLEGFVDRLTDLSSVQTAHGQLAVTRHGRVRAYTAAGEDRFADRDGVVRLVFVRGGKGSTSAFAAPLDEGFAERVDGLHRPVVLGIAAALAALAAGFALVGPFYRARADTVRETAAQAFSSRAQVLTSMLLFVSLVSFALFLRRAADPIALTLSWPDAWLVTASWTALGVGMLTLFQIALLRRVWRGSRRMPGWSAARRSRHTVSVAIFAGYTFVAAAWGALEPWSV